MRNRALPAREMPGRRSKAVPSEGDKPVQVKCVCEGAGLRTTLREDLDRYAFAAEVGRGHLGQAGVLSPRWGALLQQGLWATAAYRICHYARYRRHSQWLRMLADVSRRIVLAFTAIDIAPDAHIGPGLWIPHVGFIVIGPVRVGRNCEIFHGVTLGARESFMVQCSPRLPTLGDRVWIGPGAVVAGDVTVGDDAAVGANSLVVHDVPPRGVVLGVPARLVSRRGSFAQITYRGMDMDGERNAALAADPEADLADTIAPARARITTQELSAEMPEKRADHLEKEWIRRSAPK